MTNQRLNVYLILIILTTLLIGCAGAPKDISYTSFVENFENLDLSPLEGKTIVLDPGHGGSAPGAVGYGGLEEKEVNLNVALRLKQYLERGGVNVIMTRVTDRDMIVSELDKERGNDLDYRVRVSNEAETDLFISLHHNSNFPLDRNVNRVETYYKMSDSYTSLDAARLIHKHLVKNIQPPVHFMKPGNYYVLRNNAHTAVLGEPSHLSNPEIEKRLSKPETIDFEARSYFLGILNYFSRGIPRFTGIDPAPESVLTNPRPTFTLNVERSEFGGGLDYESVTAMIDGKEQPYSIDGDKIYVTPSVPITNGKHIFTAVARNLKGNHTILLTSQFTVDLPPSNISAYITPETLTRNSVFPVQVTAHITDRYGNAVIDGTQVLFFIEDKEGSSTEKFTKNGTVHFQVNYMGGDTLAYKIECESVKYSDKIALPAKYYNHAAFKVLDKSGKPIKNVSITNKNNWWVLTNQDGFAYANKIGSDLLQIYTNRNGYYDYYTWKMLTPAENINEVIILTPIYNKALHGKKIFIDPEFGGPESGAVGPTGLRAADENLETALYLVKLLKAAGADAVLTRNRGEDLTPYSRVQAANNGGAQLFITLRHSEASNPEAVNPGTFAYPTSSTGKKLGTIVGKQLNKYLNVNSFPVAESAEFTLQQTGCPSLIVNLGFMSNPATEELLSGTRYNRYQALSVFTALVEFYTREHGNLGQFSGVITDSDGTPVPNVIVSVTGWLTTQTNDDGRFFIDSIEPGLRMVEIRSIGFETIVHELNMAPMSKETKDFRLVKKQD